MKLRINLVRRGCEFTIAAVLAAAMVVGATNARAKDYKPGFGPNATTQPATQPAAQVGAPVKVLNDLPYKSGDALSEYEKSRCRLDLYLPEGKGFATVVWFYGGALEAGDKIGKGNVAIAQTLARQGVACAVVNYRLSPKATFPAYLDDAAASVAWVIGHAAEQGGDPKRVFISGHSAGGYLAAQIGFDPKYLAAYHLTSDDIAGLIPVSPQVFTHFTIRKERGVANPELTPVIDDAAPAFHVRPDAPPMLLLIGDHDWPARLEECQYFLAMLKLVKAPDAAMQVIADRNHGSIASKAGNVDDPAMKAMLGFIEKHRTAGPRKAATTQPATNPAAAVDHSSEDVSMIAAWIAGSGDRNAFDKPFGDREYIVNGTDTLLYSDVDNLVVPKNLKRVSYDFAKERMAALKGAHNAGPVVLITRSVRENPDDARRSKTMTKGEPIPTPADRYYYIEVGLGNLAWHTFKVWVYESEGKVKFQTPWREIS